MTKKETVTAHKYTADEQAWDELLLKSVGAPHYMQASAWGEAKTRSSWPASKILIELKDKVLPLQVFSRNVPGFGKVHYSPEVVGITAADIPGVTKQIRKSYGRGAVFKLELFRPLDEGLMHEFQAHGWRKGRSVQHRTSVISDLRGSEEEVFARLKKRARYEVRVAQRNNVRVEKVDMTQANLDTLRKLMDITAERTGGFFRDEDYTNKYWHAFAAAGQGSLYFAWHEKDLLAAAFVISLGKTAWYKDGGSVRDKSAFMAPRFLQWEIMRDMRAQGVESYDFSGIPAPDNIDNSPLKGLFAFKTGFSNDIVQFMPAMELPLGRRHKVWPKVERQYMRLYSGIRKDFWY